MKHYIINHTNESQSNANVFKSDKDNIDEEIVAEYFGYDVQPDSEIEITEIDINSIPEL